MVTAPPAFREPPAVPQDPPLTRELLAGAVTALAVLLCGPLVGLLWAAAAPRADLRPDGVPQDRETSAFIAGDGIFLAAAALTGVLTGVLGWRLARRHGLGVVLGLTFGGLAAAYLAQVVGEGATAAVGESAGGLIGRPEAAAAADPDAATATFGFRLRTPQALVGWPVGALLGFLTACSLTGLRARRRTRRRTGAPAAPQAR